MSSNLGRTFGIFLTIIDRAEQLPLVLIILFCEKSGQSLNAKKFNMSLFWVSRNLVILEFGLLHVAIFIVLT